MSIKSFFVLLVIFLSAITKAQNREQLLHQYHSTKNEKVELRTTLLNDIAWEYAYENSDSALYYGYLALQIGTQNKIKAKKTTIANTYGTLGIIYDVEGDKQKAVDNYLQSLEILKAEQDTSGIAIASNNIGALFHTMEEHEKALAYFQQSFEMELSVSDTAGAIGSLINISVCYKNLNESDKAKQLLRQAQSLSQAKDDTLAMQIHNNFGANYLHKQQLDSALNSFETAIVFADRSGNNYDQSTSFENIARIHLMQGNGRLARKNIRLALDIAEEGQFFTLLINAYETAFEVYLHQQEIDSAFLFKNRFESLRDSIRGQENMKRVDEIEAQYQLSEKERALLEKDLKIAEGENAEIFYLGTLIFSLLLIVTIALITFLKVRSNRELRSKNRLIRAALDEKEILMREIHHRVKNNIQSIKSIINIQKRKSKNPEVVEHLNLTLNRVNTMAIIHQRLYKQESIQEVTTTTYFSDLIKEAVRIYHFKESDLELNNTIDQVHLDLDTLFTLGLIINELVTNSCKYGVSEDGKLRLWFSLRAQENQLQLEFKDGGKEKESPEESSSVGSTLIQALVRKLNGKIHYILGQGWNVELIIPHESKQA